MTVHVPPRTSRMNKTEADYALVLEARKRAGQVREYHYEALRLVIGHAANYTPDFLVVLADGTVELHEVKGFMREAAHTRLAVCSRLYPFPIRLVRRNGKGWTITEVAS